MHLTRIYLVPRWNIGHIFHRITFRFLSGILSPLQPLPTTLSRLYPRFIRCSLFIYQNIPGIGLLPGWEVLRTDIQFIKLVSNTTYLCYNKKVYLRIYGTPMGLNLSPIIAEIAMNDILKTMTSNVNFEIPLQFQYLDTVLCALPRG